MNQPLSNHVLTIGDESFVDISTPTHPSAIARVDTGDLPIVIDGRGRWRAHQPSGASTPYGTRWYGPRSARRLQLLHRVVLGLGHGDPLCADHVNADGLDNRRSNLRTTTQANNAKNVRKWFQHRTTSRYKGVSYHQQNKNWRAYIRLAGRQRHLGVFDSEELAARAYDAAADEQHGEFARRNFA